MAQGINKVILVGNVGQDPEIKNMPAGGSVANFSVATSESWVDKATQQKKESTEWHRVVIFGKLADIVGQYVRKGSKLYLEGKLKTRKWTDAQGIERYTTEVIADVMQMLDSRQDGQQGQQGQQGGYQQQPQGQPRQQAPVNQPPMHPQQQGYQQQSQQGYQQQQPQQQPYNQPRGPAEPNIDFDDDIPF